LTSAERDTLAGLLAKLDRRRGGSRESEGNPRGHAR
jgi:hypothetical protein